MANTTKTSTKSTKLEDGKIDPLLDGSIDTDGELTEASFDSPMGDESENPRVVFGGINPAAGELTDDEFDDQGEVVDDGFPPYWKAAEGKMFEAWVKDVDHQEIPNLRTGEIDIFTRYVCVTTRPLRCSRGPARDAEEVIVEPGHEFTVTKYANLPLEKYLTFKIRAKCTGQQEMTGAREPMWTFKVRVEQELATAIREESAAHALFMRENFLKQARERRAEMQNRLAAIADEKRATERTRLKALTASKAKAS